MKSKAEIYIHKIQILAVYCFIYEYTVNYNPCSILYIYEYTVYSCLKYRSDYKEARASCTVQVWVPDWLQRIYYKLYSTGLKYRTDNREARAICTVQVWSTGLTLGKLGQVVPVQVWSTELTLKKLGQVVPVQV